MKNEVKQLFAAISHRALLHSGEEVRHAVNALEVKLSKLLTVYEQHEQQVSVSPATEPEKGE